MPPPDDQLPAIIEPIAPPAPAIPTGTYIVPALITNAGGDQAGWRYVEFFTANINNDHTRRAYARASSRFFAWCENRGLSLTAIRPFDVAAWVKDLQQTHGAPGVKQQLRGNGFRALVWRACRLCVRSWRCHVGDHNLKLKS
jgi:hypothetical protein